MKKFTSLLLCVVLVLSLCSMTAFAAGDDYLEASYAVDAENGTVELTLTAKQTLTNTTFRLAFDRHYLTWVGAEVNAAVSAVNATRTEATIRLATSTANAIPAGETVAVVSFALTGGWDKTKVTITVENWNDGVGVNELLAMTVEGTGYRFVDVTADAWYFEAVDKMAAAGYTKGTGNSRFSPTLHMGRCDFVTMLGRIAGVPETEAETGFVDVPVNTYYSGYVLWAYENGITTGIDATHFAPKRSLSRAEMVTFLYRYAKSAGADTTVKDADTALAAFDDAELLENKVSWAKVPFAWAVENGVINGIDGSLVPYGISSRAEVAVMLYRFFFD